METDEIQNATTEPSQETGGESSGEDIREQLEQAKGQLGSLTKAHQATLQKLQEIETQHLEVSSLKTLVANISEGLEEEKDGRIAAEIDALIAEGRMDDAESRAARDINRRVRRLGLDKDDPRLQRIKIEDQVEAHRRLRILEPEWKEQVQSKRNGEVKTMTEPAKQETSPAKSGAADLEALKAQIRAEVKAELEAEAKKAVQDKSAFKIARPAPTGSFTPDLKNPQALIMEGLRARQNK